MTDTPTEEYQDAEGNPVSLDKLCRTEPAWAANRIRAELAEKAKLKARGDKLKSKHDKLKRWIAKQDCENPTMSHSRMGPTPGTPCGKCLPCLCKPKPRKPA